MKHYDAPTSRDLLLLRCLANGQRMVMGGQPENLADMVRVASGAAFRLGLARPTRIYRWQAFYAWAQRETAVYDARASKGGA